METTSRLLVNILSNGGRNLTGVKYSPRHSKSSREDFSWDRCSVLFLPIGESEDGAY